MGKNNISLTGCDPVSTHASHEFPRLFKCMSDSVVSGLGGAGSCILPHARLTPSGHMWTRKAPDYSSQVNIISSGNEMGEC